METSIIIPTIKSVYLKDCIESIEKYTENFEIIIIKNKTFAEACNDGIKKAKNDYICFLNDDTLVTPDWLLGLKDCFRKHDDCGLAGPTTCYSRGLQCDNILMNKRYVMTKEDILHYASNLEPGEYKTELYGFCMLSKKSILEDVGNFSTDYGYGNYEENDLQLRLRMASYESYWVQHSYVHHYGHVTFNELGIDLSKLLSENRRIFEKRKKEIEDSMGGGLHSKDL